MSTTSNQLSKSNNHPWTAQEDALLLDWIHYGSRVFVHQQGWAPIQIDSFPPHLAHVYAQHLVCHMRPWSRNIQATRQRILYLASSLNARGRENHASLYLQSEFKRIQQEFMDESSANRVSESTQNQEKDPGHKHPLPNSLTATDTLNDNEMIPTHQGHSVP